VSAALLRRVVAARTALLLDPRTAFFGALTMRLRLEVSDEVPTAATDGARIVFNEEFCAPLSDSALRGLLVHEVMHVANGHPWRRDARDPKRWNIACDYAINGELVACGFELPAGGLLDPQYTGKPSEWIYDRLPAELPEEQPGGVLDASGDEDAPTEADWKVAVQQAAQVCAARGELPAGLKRFAEKAAAPRADWRSALLRFVQLAARDDYTWRRPAARYVSHGLYLPSLRSERMGRLAVAIDVSGSVDAVLLSQFAAELQSILDDCRPEAIDVLYCDARIQRRDSFGPGDSVQLEACGGGGTDFRPVFAELEDEQPVALVYLTDLYGTFPPHAPDYPVLWGVTDDAPTGAPFGELVAVQ
jgi:predicted metal-dependent peptidase